MKDGQDVRKRIKEISDIGSAVKFLFTAFVLVSFFTLALGEGNYTELSFADGKSVFVYILLIAAIGVLLAAAELFFGKYKAVEWVLFVSSVAFSLLVVGNTKTGIQHHIYASVMVVMAIIINYVSYRGCFDVITEKLDKRIKWGLISAAVLSACVIVAAIGVLRYATYAAPNFDFGIWCNMFHNMKETGLPNTTCERDGFLSHFAVHCSPIYYVMLPLYLVFPRPETLQILQAVILYSGVIPLCIMAKHKGLTDRATVVFAFIYSFYPAVASGTFYDLHENCFLVPLLLWCFCFYEKEKYLPMGLFAFLTLLVKEDAFVYLLIFALFVFFSKGKKRVALGLALGAIVYFAVISSLMKAYGNGIMVGRYDNLIVNPDDGLIGVLKTAILNPGYLLTQLFVSKDSDNSKILYVFQLLLPLGFLPFATKKLSRYILTAPILINLITMYVYQPNIRFQYSFGVIAFLFYGAQLNLSELGAKTKRITLPIGAVAGLLMFSMLVVGNFGYYADRYEREKESYALMTSALEEILPEDASVTCSTYILPHIASRSVIYEAEYHKENGKYKTDTEYAVFDMRYEEKSLEIAEVYFKNGYEEIYNRDNLLVLKKKA